MQNALCAFRTENCGEKRSQGAIEFQRVQVHRRLDVSGAPCSCLRVELDVTIGTVRLNHRMPSCWSLLDGQDARNSGASVCPCLVPINACEFVVLSQDEGIDTSRAVAPKRPSSKPLSQERHRLYLRE